MSIAALAPLAADEPVDIISIAPDWAQPLALRTRIRVQSALGWQLFPCCFEHGALLSPCLARSPYLPASQAPLM